jgi:succinate dehydrogenase hydrophobic anchor subunit
MPGINELNLENHQPARENYWLWLVKMVSGLLVIVLLGIHFYVNHHIGETGLLTYEDVIKYFQNPIIPIMEISFLIIVVSHSLLGLRSIFLDINPSQKYITFFDLVFVIIGVTAIGYGIWLAMTIASVG